MENINLQPTLENDLVLIRPLADNDFDTLYAAANDPLIWEQHTAERFKKDVFASFFRESMESGGALVVIHKKTGKIIGSSRYKPIPDIDTGVEIGWSFLSREFWGGEYNKAVKSLLIDHALDFYDDIIFYIDKNNIRSQKAVGKIGGEKLPADSKYMINRRNADYLAYIINKQNWKG